MSNLGEEKADIEDATKDLVDSFFDTVDMMERLQGSISEGIDEAEKNQKDRQKVWDKEIKEGSKLFDTIFKEEKKKHEQAIAQQKKMYRKLENEAIIPLQNSLSPITDLFYGIELVLSPFKGFLEMKFIPIWELLAEKANAFAERLGLLDTATGETTDSMSGLDVLVEGLLGTLNAFFWTVDKIDKGMTWFDDTIKKVVLTFQYLDDAIFQILEPLGITERELQKLIVAIQGLFQIIEEYFKGAEKTYTQVTNIFGSLFNTRDLSIMQQEAARLE